ncbi:hypothetical protein EAE96_006219 [Botrytis aclada]|nr:hypothetical protein EAE96_006219 [Botrytis aclada]
MADNIDDLIAQLSLEERLSLIAGHSTWRTAVVERLGIQNLKFSDGPSGARGEIFGEGVPAAFIPSGVSLGATWDEQLLFEVGELLAEETISKSASVVLAPTTCIQRHPLGGRNFESFSEDPFLTGKLAAAHVRGVQSKGIGATPKHYVANDPETKRFHSNAVIPTRALREVYLLPFQMVVRDAQPWCIMTAYNKVNGLHCDMSKTLQIDIPRTEWKWDGVFLSDWGGTNSSAESINAGLDLEMPGPPNKRFTAAMKVSLSQGTVNLKRIDESVRRMLTLLEKAGRLGKLVDGKEKEEICLDLPSQRTKLHDVACAGIVLLKNENNALPLKPTEAIKKLAIVRPNAKRVVAGGGGSSYIKAPYWTSVYDSVRARFESQSTEIVHAVGARVNRYVPTSKREITRDPDTGEMGAAVDWFLGHEFDGEIITTTHIDDLYYMSFGDVPPEMNKAETKFGFRVRTELTPVSTDHYKLSIASIGPSKTYIDGDLCATISGDFENKGTLFFTYGSPEFVFEKEMIAGQPYNVEINCCSHDRQLQDELLELMDPMEDKFQGARLGFEEKTQIDLPRDAAEIAHGSDALPAYIDFHPQLAETARLNPAMYAAALCSGATALKALHEARVQPNDVIVISGIAGAIGHLAGALARNIFHARVIGVDFGWKLDGNRELFDGGMAAFCDMAVPAPTHGDKGSWLQFQEKLSKACARMRPSRTTPHMADAVIVTASSFAAFDRLHEYICDGASIVCVGVPRGECNISIPLAELIERQLKVHGNLMGGPEEAYRVMEYIYHGVIKPKIIEIRIDEIPKYLNLMVENKVVGKVVANINGSCF